MVIGIEYSNRVLVVVPHILAVPLVPGPMRSNSRVTKAVLFWRFMALPR